MSTLVVMQSAFDGWQVRDQAGNVHSPGATGGFLSVAGVRPGETYVLSYRPPQFVLGAALSVAGLLAVAGLVWLDLTMRRGAGAVSHSRGGGPADGAT
jgi:hypothetical protein